MTMVSIVERSTCAVFRYWRWQKIKIITFLDIKRLIPYNEVHTPLVGND